MAEWARDWEQRGLGAVGQKIRDMRVTDGPFTQTFAVCAATEQGAICLAQEATQRPGCFIEVLTPGGHNAD